MERAIDSIRNKMRKLKEHSKLINHIYGAEVTLAVVERWEKESRGDSADGTEAQAPLTVKEEAAECIDNISALEASLRASSNTPGVSATQAVSQQKRQLAAERGRLGGLLGALPTGFLATAELRRSYQIKRAQELRSEASITEGAKAALQLMLNGGKKSKFLPTSSMKADARKRIESLARQLKSVEEKAKSYPAACPSPGVGRYDTPPVPMSDKVSVVRLVAGIERSAEELAEKPGEFHDFYMACRRDATALRKAADAKLKSGSATGRGRAVVLRRFAQKRVRLAEAAKSLAEGAGHAEGSAQAWAQFGVRALGALAKCENFEGLICL